MIMRPFSLKAFKLSAILFSFLFGSLSSFGQSAFRFQGVLTDLQGLPISGYISIKTTDGGIAFGQPNAIGPQGNFDISYGLPLTRGQICLVFSTNATPLVNMTPFDHRQMLCLDLNKWEMLTFANSQEFLVKDSYRYSVNVKTLPSDDYKTWCGLRFQKPPNADVKAGWNVFYFDGSRAWCPDSHEKLNTISTQTFSEGNLISGGSFEGKTALVMSGGHGLPYPHWNSDRARSDGGEYWLYESPGALTPIDGAKIASVRIQPNWAGTNLTQESGNLVSEYFPVVPGGTYNLGFFYNRKNFTGELEGNVKPVIRLYASKGSPELQPDPYSNTVGSGYGSFSDQWQYYRLTFYPTSASRFARIELISVDDLATGGIFYFDNVVVNQMTNGNYLDQGAPSQVGTSTVTYANGFGLPIQKKSRMTPESDVYSQIEYDELFRPIKSSSPLGWNAYSGASKNGFLPDVFSKTNAAYNGTTLPDAGGFAYSETVYESNPIGRPNFQSHPGSSWQISGIHTDKNFHFASSNLNESDLFPAEILDGSGAYSYSVALDAENKPVRSFTDKFGRLIRSATYSGTAWVNTDYEYDANGNMTREIAPPGPGGTRNSVVKSYNSMGMLLTEESPDFGKNIFIYDANNRLRFSQSQVQRAATPQRFSYVKYDLFNRAIESGESLQGAGFTSANADIQGFPFKNDLRTLPRTFNFYDKLPGDRNFCEDVPGRMNIVIRSDANPQNPYEYLNLNAAYNGVQSLLSGLTEFWGAVRFIQVFDNASQLVTPVAGSNFTPFTLSNPNNLVPFTITGVLRNSSEFRLIAGDDYPFPFVWGDFRGRLAQTVTCNTDLIGEVPGMKQVSTIFNYDKYGRITAEFEFNGYVQDEYSRWQQTSFEYNVGGQLLRKTFHESVNQWFTSQHGFCYEYNSRGDLIYVNDCGDNEFTQVASLDYYPDGSLKEKIVGPYLNGVEYGYKYNARGWLTRSTASRFDQQGILTPVQEEDLRYDWGSNSKFDGNIGNYFITDKANTHKQWAYVYSPLNRLKNAILYTNGNVLSPETFTYTYYDNGAFNAVTKYGTQFTYNYQTYLDPSNQTLTGNRLNHVYYPGFHSRDTRGYNNFQYDASGRLRLDASKNLNIDFGDNDRPYYFNHIEAGTNDNSEYMVYDGSGNRKSKISYLNGNWSATTHYMNNGKEIKESSTNPTEAYYPYDSFGKMKFTANGTPVPEIYVKDYLGSTNYSIDVTTGTFKYQTEYEPYGKTRNEATSPGISVTQKFTDKEHDAGIELDYFGARYYDSDLGVWISPDPARQYFSPYTYCGSLPNSCIDGDGRRGAPAANWGHNYFFQTFGRSIDAAATGLPKYAADQSVGLAKSPLVHGLVNTYGLLAMLVPTGAASLGAIVGLGTMSAYASIDVAVTYGMALTWAGYHTAKYLLLSRPVETIMFLDGVFGDEPTQHDFTNPSEFLPSFAGDVTGFVYDKAAPTIQRGIDALRLQLPKSSEGKEQ